MPLPIDDDLSSNPTYLGYTAAVALPTITYVGAEKRLQITNTARDAYLRFAGLPILDVGATFTLKANSLDGNKHAGIAVFFGTATSPAFYRCVHLGTNWQIRSVGPNLASLNDELIMPDGTVIGGAALPGFNVGDTRTIGVEIHNEGLRVDAATTRARLHFTVDGVVVYDAPILKYAGAITPGLFVWNGTISLTHVTAYVPAASDEGVASAAGLSGNAARADARVRGRWGTVPQGSRVYKEVAGVQTPYGNANVIVSRRNDGRVAWQGRADADGAYQPWGLDLGREHVAVATDDTNTFAAAAAGPFIARAPWPTR